MLKIVATYKTIIFERFLVKEITCTFLSLHFPPSLPSHTSNSPLTSPHFLYLLFSFPLTSQRPFCIATSYFPSHFRPPPLSSSSSTHIISPHLPWCLYFLSFLLLPFLLFTTTPSISLLSLLYFSALPLTSIASRFPTPLR